MRIGVLTSSRADFGIYLPLLKRLQADDFFKLEIIAFGTHLSTFHGETICGIIAEGFDVKYRIESMLLTDTAESISTAIGLTIVKFSTFWSEHAREFDLILCLGDRYEMFGAVTAGIAFNVPFAHFHGGETTLGAIDNTFRHSITLASKYHFVSTKPYGDRVAAILGTTDHIYHSGALSLENISDMELLDVKEFQGKWGIDLANETVLITFHPETMNSTSNVAYVNELILVIKRNSEFQFLITMPNADTAGNTVRRILIERLADDKNVYLIENLGSKSYFTAMKYCSFLLGNTSSGIIEAASFGKYVVNLGERQRGRATSGNIFDVPFVESDIQKAIEIIKLKDRYTGENIYYKNNTVSEIINFLKQIPIYANS